MRFDYVIGNPPYQAEKDGGNKDFMAPVYDKFLDAAYNIGECVEMIHPARFLFNAGQTPKEWNKKMLCDTHLKVLVYEEDASKIFSNTDIKGGVAITYRDNKRDFGAIGLYSPYDEINSILKKVKKKKEDSIMGIIFTQNRFNLKNLYESHPDYRYLIGSDGRDKRFRNNIFDYISAFKEERQSNDDLKIIGVIKNKRNWRYISKSLVDLSHENLFLWKVIIPRANGKGSIGDVLSSPIVLSPNEGYTQTFIGIGAFQTKREAENANKYIKTRFARTMLGTLKHTQDNERGTWLNVPLQDFSEQSELNWDNSISEIDEQLYKKYELSDDEIAFIKANVKEMQ